MGWGGAEGFLEEVARPSRQNRGIGILTFTGRNADGVVGSGLQGLVHPIS